VDANTKDGVLSATKELLEEMVKSNDIHKEDVACIIFTTTPDLNAEFPAVAAREMGFSDVALLCAQEMNIPRSLPLCLRILMLVNTEKDSHEMVHIYLKGAKSLRPDIGGKG